LYRKVADFLADWTKSAEGTRKVLEAMSDEKLDQAIVEGHNTLGWLGWHITTSIPFFAGLVGLSVTPPGDKSRIPVHAKEILEAYQKVSEELKRQVKEKLTDENLTEEVSGVGNPAPRGALLRALIDHQTHHRGQMTVLLRQAGLPVPGVMGPTKEERMKEKRH